MSYEWIRRRQRYLGFRYLFPEVVAPWIQCKRGLLRVLWFFTHPLDELFETIGEILAWPFVAIGTVFAWMSAGIWSFYEDLVRGVKVLLRTLVTLFQALGRLPVWTGAAIAGSLGVILTTLLFFLSLMQFRPVPASISSTSEEVPAQTPQPTLTQPPAEPDDSFDPFAGSESESPAAPAWQPTPVETKPADLSMQIERLSLPPGWDARRRFEVVSTATEQNAAPSDPFGQRSFSTDGWTLTQIDRAPRPQRFMPYVSRHGVQAVRNAPSWVTATESIGPFQRVDSERRPAVTISRSTPTAAVAGSSLTYELLVSNQGAEPLDSVTVHEVVSALDRVLDVDPPASVVGDSLVWNITDLGPGQQRRITIQLQPDQLQPITGGSTVEVKTGIAALTRVSAPRPEPVVASPEPEDLIAATPPPQTEPQFDEPPPEESPADNQDSSPEIGMILPSFDDPPEEPEPFLPFADKPDDPPQSPPGKLLPVEDEPALAVMPARAVEEPNSTVGDLPIEFEMRTPKLAAKDTPVPAVFEIRNRGSSKLTDLVIQVQLTEELHHQQGRLLRHRIDSLSPGEVYRTRLTTTAIGDGTARLTSTLTSAEDLQTDLEAAVEISKQPASESPRRIAISPRRFTCGP